MYCFVLQNQSAKAKIQDLVAVRHGSAQGKDSSGNSERTTVIVLNDDGSLRIYLASPDTTDFWLKPSLSRTNVFGNTALVKRQPSTSSTNSEFVCYVLNDITAFLISGYLFTPLCKDAKRIAKSNDLGGTFFEK